TLGFPEAQHITFGEGGAVDNMTRFETDDGAKLEAFLGNIGSKVASGTKSVVNKAADLGRDRSMVKFHYSEGGVSKGPVLRRDLDTMVQENKLPMSVFVLAEGSKDWIKYDALLAKEAPAAATTPPPPPPPDAGIPRPPDAAGISA